MKPPPFAYARPATIEEALDILAAETGALAMAGGQSLVPMLNMRLARPTTVVDLCRLKGLSEIDLRPEALRIGALVTHAALGAHAATASIRALVEGVSQIGYQAIRHRGTVGGSLAHADPAAELPALTLTLDAVIGLKSTSAAREIAAEDFFLGYYSTARHHDELVTGVTIPISPGLRTGFAEFSRRPGDFAIALASVAMWATPDRPEARVVVGGLDVRPRRLHRIEALLVDGGPAAALSAATRHDVESETEPSSDIHASAGHRLDLGLEMVKRAISQLEGS